MKVREWDEMQLLTASTQRDYVLMGISAITWVESHTQDVNEIVDDELQSYFVIL